MTDHHFRQDNTSGYSDADLAELNRRLDAAVAAINIPTDEYGDPIEPDTSMLIEHIGAQIQADFDLETQTPTEK